MAATSKPPSSAKSDAVEESAAKEPEYITGLKLALVVGSVSLIGFLMLLDQSILSTAIPRITSKFHSLPDVGWYTGVYQLGCAALQPLTGKLYTHLRTKHVFLAHLFIFELGSLICGAATSSAMLIGGRTLAGLGGAGLMNGALTILSNSTPLEKRPLYTGLMIGISQMGIVMGPLVGGALTEHATWRWCFYINLPVGAIASLIIFFVRIPDPVPKAPYSLKLLRTVIPQLDLPGFSLFAPSCVMFLLALQFGGDEKYLWNSATIIGLFCGAGATAVAFVLWEARVGEKAMIPGAMLKHRILVASAGYNICLTVCMLVGSTWLPMYFQAVRGASPTMSGVYLLPSILTQLLISIASGIAVSRLGYYLPWAVVGGAVTAIGNGLVSTLTASTPTARWVGFLIILGAGRGAGMQIAMVATQNALPPSMIAVSLAFLIFIQNLAASVFSVVTNTIFEQTLISKLPEYAPSVSPKAALNAGGSAEAVRALVPMGGGHELDGVLKAYSDALRNLWYLLVGFAVAAFLFGWGTGWKDVRKKDVEGEQPDDNKIAEEGEGSEDVEKGKV